MLKDNFKKFLCYCKVLCLEYLTYPGTYCAAIVLFAICLIVPTVTLEGGYYSIPVLIFDSDLYEQALNTPTCCAQLVAQRFIEAPLFRILFSTIVSFPALRIFRGNADIVQKPVVIRTNKRPYRAGLFVTTFLSGFIITLIGVMLYVVTAFSLFTPVSAFDDMDFIEAYSNFVSITNLIKKIANVCTISGIFSIFTVIISAVVHDKFLALTLPVMLQYISMKIWIVYSSWLYSDMERSTNRFLLFIEMMMPFSLTNHYSSWEHLLKLPFACFFVFAAVVIAGLYVIFGKLMERSIGDKI